MMDAAELKKATDFLSSEGAKVLLLTCIDHRIQAQIPCLMELLNFDVKKKEYDQIILPGASLAALLNFGPDQKPHWRLTFLETLFLSIEAHDINGLVIFDHTDCGAYRRYWKSMGLGDHTPEKETSQHWVYMEQLARDTFEEVKRVRRSFYIICVLLPTQTARTDPRKLLDAATLKVFVA